MRRPCTPLSAGTLPVDLHVDGRDNRATARIAGRASDGIFCQLGLDLVGVGAVVGQVRAADGDFDRRRRAEAHHLVDDVGRLEGKLQPLDALGDLSSGTPSAAAVPRSQAPRSPGSSSRKSLFQLLDAHAAAGFRATRSTASSGPLVHR